MTHVRRVARAMGPPSHDTIAAITVEMGPDVADWVRGLAEAVDRKGERDRAIRRAAALMSGSSVSGMAKSVEAELRRYIGGAWPRERHLLSLPPGASQLRIELHRIARLTGGDGLAWRRLVEIIEA